jgi:leucyl-tRNA synthetase
VQTVLANEQVEAGLCWRCSTDVVEKTLDQWFFRITAYVEELLEGCDRLSGWPERVLTMQRNWIGKSHGFEMIFPMADGNGEIKVFTTRQDTIYGATFMLIAAEHPLVLELAKGKECEKEVQEFVEKIKRQDKNLRTSDYYEKEGVFRSRTAEPGTHKRCPSSRQLCLADYGTGASWRCRPTTSATSSLPSIIFRHRGHPAAKYGPQCPDHGRRPTSTGILVNSGPFKGWRT